MTPNLDAASVNVSCPEVMERIWRAVRQVQDSDGILLAMDVHEVTVSHRLAMYLEPHFRGWHADVEYNRIGKDHEERNPDRIKRIAGKKVYPDIIVHKRGEPNNLVVIEVKLSTNDESRDGVRDRLRSFQEEVRLEYQHGVLLDLPSGEHHPGEPYIECITCGRSQVYGA